MLDQVSVVSTAPNRAFASDATRYRAGMSCATAELVDGAQPEEDGLSGVLAARAGRIQS
ncbi:hypothetical protein ACQPW1_26000 [Nocardia sp. CA-128927]|uniref:hypothetical protein n=1 Tax=Nocardia sp. CA-128927 TaxID=3239975 RepID=UPI003D952043